MKLLVAITYIYIYIYISVHIYIHINTSIYTHLHILLNEAVRFEPTTTEFRSDALTYGAIRP